MTKVKNDSGVINTNLIEIRTIREYYVQLLSTNRKSRRNGHVRRKTKIINIDSRRSEYQVKKETYTKQIPDSDGFTGKIYQMFKKKNLKK